MDRGDEKMYRVMLVDDEPTAVNLIKTIIKMKCSNYEVIAIANHGQEALELMETEIPDLIITDINMPVMGGLQLLEVVKDTSLSSEAALKKIFRIIIDVCQENPKLFTVLLSYLIQLQKSGGDPEERVRRRVIKIRHIICIVLIRGMKSGEVKKVNLKATTEMLYSVFESAIFKIAVLNKTEISDMIDVADVAIENLMA